LTHTQQTKKTRLTSKGKRHGVPAGQEARFVSDVSEVISKTPPQITGLLVDRQFGQQPQDI
jgi:hypothetical protein